MNILDTVIANTNPALASRATRGRDLIKTVGIGASFNQGARSGWGATGSSWGDMRDGVIDFPVAERKLVAQGKMAGIEVPNHKAIIREYHGQPAVLGVVGAGYQVLKTGDAVNSMIEALETALPLSAFEGAIRRDLSSYKGAMTACEIVLPALGGEVQTSRGFRSNVAFRIILRNSYDGSGSVRLLSGMIDFFCTNGCVVGDLDVGAFRHTSGLSVAKLVRQVSRSADRFTADLQKIKAWAQHDVSRDMVVEAVKDLPGISDRKANTLIAAYDREMQVRGPSFWSLMSALTADATHGALRDTGSDHAAATILDRQMQAARWTDNLAAALT
jgi:hypothetical protein